MRWSHAAISTLALLFGPAAFGQVGHDFKPVTKAMLEDPDPADWLMYSRTYDAQRFSPLDQIN
ncbi:MAG: PQQ-dependent dehydrogenase, methanol/ethanol family, partial [Gammaproteobacteria bacterium]